MSPQDRDKRGEQESEDRWIRDQLRAERPEDDLPVGFYARARERFERESSARRPLSNWKRTIPWIGTVAAAALLALVFLPRLYDSGGNLAKPAAEVQRPAVLDSVAGDAPDTDNGPSRRLDSGDTSSAKILGEATTSTDSNARKDQGLGVGSAAADLSKARSDKEATERLQEPPEREKTTSALRRKEESKKPADEDDAVLRKSEVASTEAFAEPKVSRPARDAAKTETDRLHAATPQQSAQPQAGQRRQPASKSKSKSVSESAPGSASESALESAPASVSGDDRTTERQSRIGQLSDVDSESYERSNGKPIEVARSVEAARSDSWPGPYVPDELLQNWKIGSVVWWIPGEPGRRLVCTVDPKSQTEPGPIRVVVVSLPANGGTNLTANERIGMSPGPGCLVRLDLDGREAAIAYRETSE